MLPCLQKKAILTTIGVLEEPLGNARLHGARLMAALLHTNTPSINQELCRLNTMGLLLVSGHGGGETGPGPAGGPQGFLSLLAFCFGPGTAQSAENRVLEPARVWLHPE